jgi:D-alanine-D-alanine ligase-like ATP-grasp enzyme
MRICLLTNQDLLADPFPADDWPCDPRPYYPEAKWEVEYLKHGTSVAQVERRIGERFDLYFNLCDGAADQNIPGIEVVRTLEQHGVAFTGATSEFYEPSREAMKRACRAEGIATPAYVHARNEADVERAVQELRFPLFVKHYSSYSSVDLSRRSRVLTPAGLRQQARKIMRRHGAALIEEFIAGTECTVLVVEDPDAPMRARTYTPMQYRFPVGETFKHAEIKWVNYDSMQAVPVADPALDARLRDACARFFVALGGASFGRCDLRVDGSGTPFMLEINPNCGVYYPLKDAGSADLCLAHDPEGHVGFTRQLIRAALHRQHRRSISARREALHAD